LARYSLTAASICYAKSLNAKKALFLYDFLTNSLLPFYGAPNLIERAREDASDPTGMIYFLLTLCAFAEGEEILSMQDVIFVVVAIVFFALSLGYVQFCDRIR
jgi:hypothetical protein